jgi:hypothetical protein
MSHGLSRCRGDVPRADVPRNLTRLGFTKDY